MHIGKWVRRMRLERGLTQVELAERCGMYPQAIQRLERQPSVTTATLERVAAGLGAGLSITLGDPLLDIWRIADAAVDKALALHDIRGIAERGL